MANVEQKKDRKSLLEALIEVEGDGFVEKSSPLDDLVKTNKSSRLRRGKSKHAQVVRPQHLS